MQEKKPEKLQTFNSSYFLGKSQFEDDGTQNYLVFQPVYKQIKMLATSCITTVWESKCLSDESIKPTSNNSQNPAIYFDDSTKIQVKFDGSSLQQDKVTFTLRAVLYFYIFYKIDLQPYYAGADFALVNSSFGAAKVTKNAGLDKYSYSEYGIGFDVLAKFIVKW